MQSHARLHLGVCFTCGLYVSNIQDVLIYKNLITFNGINQQDKDTFIRPPPSAFALVTN